MLGLSVFYRSVLGLVENAGVVLRLSALPMLAVFLLTVYSSVDQIAFDAEQGFELSGWPLVMSALALLFYGIVVCAVAIGWHRFSLKGDEPAAAWPRLDAALLFNYILAVLRMVPILLLVFLAMAIVLGVLIFAIGLGRVSTNDATLWGFGLNVLVSYFIYRYAMVLPAASIGAHISVFDSWRKTKPFSGMIFVVSICFAAVTFVPSLLSWSLIGSVQGVWFNAFMNWITTMVGVSTVTTIYGHLKTEESVADVFS